MPQLEQLALVYQSQWLWLAIVLGTIFVVVGLWILPKVESTIEDRDAKIASDLEAAQRMQDEAEASEEAWRTKVNEARAEAQAITANAREKAQADIAKKVAKADSEIATKTDAAEAELTAARDAALAELEAVATEAAQDIVSKLTGAKVAAGDARKAVAGVLGNA